MQAMSPEIRKQYDKLMRLARMFVDYDSTVKDQRIAELERGINAATDAHDIAETQNESLKEEIERLRSALDEIAKQDPPGGEAYIAKAALEKDSNLLCKKHNRCRLDDGRCMECEAALEGDKNGTV